MREILGLNVVSNPDPTRCVVETSGFKLINFTVKSVASIAQLVERSPRLGLVGWVRIPLEASFSLAVSK